MSGDHIQEVPKRGWLWLLLLCAVPLAAVVPSSTEVLVARLRDPDPAVRGTQAHRIAPERRGREWGIITCLRIC
jgi:hypothetical protein